MFLSESAEILSEMRTQLKALEAHSGQVPQALLKDLAQKIDRIMGAAKTYALSAPSYLGFRQIGAVTALGKILGYQAADTKDVKLVPVLVAFWRDIITTTEKLLASVENSEKCLEITRAVAPAFSATIELLAAKIIPGPAGYSRADFDNLVFLLLALDL